MEAGTKGSRPKARFPLVTVIYLPVRGLCAKQARADRRKYLWINYNTDFFNDTLLSVCNLIEINGLFGSQSHFAKLKLDYHSFVGRCVIYAKLWLLIFCFSYDPLIIEQFLPKFGFKFFSHTFYGYHTIMISHTLA
jgi:hypothetical protein